MTVLDRVRGHVAQLRTTSLPAPLVDKARAHLLDCLVMAAAAREHPAVVRAAGADLPLGPSATTAFRLGVAIEALGLDDYDEATRIHPGAVVVPAVLGVAANLGRSVGGADLRAALVAGYELTCRFGEVVDAQTLHDRGSHPTAVCGALGAAVAASVLTGTDAGAACGMAASLSAGVFELDGAAEIKGLQTGWAAQAGIAAERLAAAGWRPAEAVVEGPRGWLRSLGSAGADPSALDAAFDGSSRLERIGFKPYSHFTDLHPATAALLQALHQTPSTPEGITAIDVRLPRIVGDHLAGDLPPPSARLARRSPAFALAAFACHADRHGQIDPLVAVFDGSHLHDPAILALAQRIRWRADLDVGDDDLPGAVVTVHLADGSVCTGEMAGYPGDGRRAATRWGWAEVADRARGLAPDAASALVAAIEGLDGVTDVRPAVEHLLGQLLE